MEDMSKWQYFWRQSTCLKEAFSAYDFCFVVAVALVFSFYQPLLSSIINTIKSYLKTKHINPEVLSLGAEVQRLKSELSHISPTAEFSSYFKTERILNKKLEEYDAAVAKEKMMQPSQMKVEMGVKVFAQGVGLLLLHFVSGINMLKRECKKRLPESGLYNDDGYLFHHTSGQPLTREDIERLRQHDIPYEKRSRFNPAEDEQIRKNWKRFAAKHNLDYEKAPGYAGVPGYKIFADNEERAAFNRTTAFWPHICHNLPHRSAAQVRRRIGMIFDPTVIEGKAEITYSKKYEFEIWHGHGVPWTDKQTRKLLRYYKVFGMSAAVMHEIGKLLNRPAHSCQNQLRNSLARRGPVPVHLRKKLWAVIMKYSNDQEKPFKRLVRQAIYHSQYQAVQDYDDRTDWNIVAQRMVYPFEHVKEAWLHLLKDLQNNYVKQRECWESRKEAWSAAFNAVLNPVPPITCEGFSTFLHIISDQTPEDTMYEILTRKLFNCEFLASKLREEGITGFYCGGSSELNYLFRKTRAILWRVHHLLFRRLKMPFTLKERLHILSMAYDYQCGFENGHQIDRPKQFEGLKLTMAGFPALHRSPFVEALVVYSLAKFEDWIAPTVLKKYVVSEDVLALFPKERNNSEIIKQKDLKAAVSFIDLDVSSESSLSESDLDNIDDGELRSAVSAGEW